jgi:sulfate permease, SulP family
MAEEGAARRGSRVRDELRPRTLIPSLTAGLIIGILEVVLAASFTALIFFGDAAIHLPMALGVNLFAAMVMLAVVAFGSSLPGVVGSLQDVTTAILALISVAVIRELPGAYHETFLTLLAICMVATFITGVFLLVLGRRKLGNLVRFIPYPVIGGFLAGTGWLLVKGGMGLLVGRGLTLQTLHRFFRPDPLLKWVPGVLFAVILLFLVRRFRHFLIIPAAVVVGVVVFYVVLYATDNSVVIAKIHGWVLGPFPYAQNLWDPSTLRVFTKADWLMVLKQGVGIATVPLVAVFALLLNASGIELARRREANLNRELGAAGVGNLVGSIFGGVPGFQALSLTALAQRTGTTSRLVGLVAAAVCGLTLLFGANMLSLFPRTVLGGLVVFLGLAFLVEWVWDARSKLVRRDYMVVLLILLAVAALGFLPGVGLGLILAIVLFVIDYSRTDVVKNELSGDTYRSKVDRAPAQQEVLRQAGDRILILRLQGIVFFGTANTLLERIRRQLADRGAAPVSFLLLDFERVTGLDSSAVLAFLKIQQVAEARGMVLVLSALSAPVRRQLDRGGFNLEDREKLRVVADLDHGAQWAEDRLLAEAGVAASPAAPEPDGFGLGVDASRLMGYLEPLEVPAGHEVIAQGEPADDLYFLESGRLTAVLRLEDGDSVRLRTMAAGVAVGEVGMYLRAERTASVVADTPSRLYRLTRQSLEEIHRRDPELAAEVHRGFARLMARRLADSLEAMEQLLE